MTSAAPATPRVRARRVVALRQPRPATLQVTTEVLRRLQKRYGPRRWRSHGKALDVLVDAMLSQNTNMANAAAGYRQLRRAFPTWRRVLDAPVEQVQRQIAVCGLARMRAYRLQALLRRILEERGRLSLQFLGRLEPAAAYDYLMGFKGIGPKTAAYTLLFAFDAPLFPVDNGILRVARRLRLVRAKARDAEASAVLGKFAPPGQVYAMHVLMFRHAKALCRPRNPQCRDCPLLSLCPEGQRRLKHRPPPKVDRAPPVRSRRRVSLSAFASAGVSKRSGDEGFDDGSATLHGRTNFASSS